MKMNRFKIFVVVLLFLLPTFGDTQSIPKWKLQDLQNAIENATGPTIINFWATICKPCIEEIPYFQQVADKYKSDGVKLILVSLDMTDAYPNKIKSFAAKRKFTAPIVFLDESNADKFCPIVNKEWSGAIPAILFINNQKGYRAFFEDKLSKEKLQEQIKQMLQSEKL